MERKEKVEKALKEIGIDLYKENGKQKTELELLDEIAQKWNEIIEDENQKEPKK
jgi:hypothetical protein